MGNALKARRHGEDVSGEYDRLVNPTAEAALLGAMMIDNKLIVGVADSIAPTDFADALHGRIYSAMLRFAAKQLRADAVTLRPIFAQDSECRNGEYLGDLVASPAVTGAAESLARQVADLAARRKVREVLKEQLTSIHDDLDVGIDEITARVESAGWAASSRREADITYDAGDMAGLVLDRDERISENPDAVGLHNRLVEDMDLGLGMMERGTYNIVAGRPGMGKTALANSLALGYAISGHAGLYVNLEMKPEQMALRTTADIAHAMGMPVEHSVLRKGNLTRDVRQDVRKVIERAKLLPLRYVAPGRSDVKRIWTFVAQHKAMWEAQGRELEFVVIDYLGLLGARLDDGRAIQNGYERVSAVSKSLKALADQMNVSVIALAQLSRAVEQRPNKRPMMSDLRESGDLEQDADSVTLLYREEYYLEQEKPKPGELGKDKRPLFDDWEAEMFAAKNKLDLIFAKNRHGRSSTRTSKFLPAYSAVRSGSFDEFTVESAPLLDF